MIPSTQVPALLGLKMRMSFRLLSLCTLTVVGLLLVQSVPAAAAGAPPLRQCQSSAQRDLGLWDDVFVCPDQDLVLLRCESDLFGLSIAGSAKPSKLITIPTLTESKIVACAGSDKRLWVFIQSSQRGPFAIDVNSGREARFNILGLKIPGSHSPEIQSHVIIRHADAAILMVSGGDRETWPMDKNWPLYFWINLKSGKVLAFPIGWELDYFSPDQKIAVFSKPQQEKFKRRPLQAVDVRTCEFVSDIPDQRHVGFVPFDWTETQPVKPLYEHHAETGDQDWFAGISVNGSVFPFDLGSVGEHYMSVAKVCGDFAGFRLRPSGGIEVAPSPFWLTTLSRGQKPELVANGVTDFVMLGNGNCVFAVNGYGHKGLHTEAFYRRHTDKTVWNVLESVERLPELDKKLADKGYIEDKMSVRFIEGFGGTLSNRLALCLSTQFRADMRAGGMTQQELQLLRPITWRRALLLTSDGQRYLTDLFRSENPPDQLWLHNSGRVLLAVPGQGNKLQLSEISLRLHENPTENGSLIRPTR